LTRVPLLSYMIRYVDASDVSAVLRRARLGAGLTQADLAVLAETSQSAIAAYEAGAREPSWSVLERVVRASGHLLELAVRPDPAVFRLADLAEEIADTPDERVRLRLVFEFLRAAGEDGHSLRLLVAAEPAPTGDERFDALLAAIAEDLCVHAGIRPPSWVHDDDRFLNGLWWVSELPSARAGALVHAPASYRRRGVMIARHDLEAA
jgi:transcriptional regulator with XRE-family HTH domain